LRISHEAAFGFRPAKPGTAYERLSAVVLATLGWQEVVHDTTESVPGKLAEHQLDVTGRHPSGEIRRLIVECKDWDQVVDHATLDKLVGVRAQVGADAAAAMTTRPTTRATSGRRRLMSSARPADWRQGSPKTQYAARSNWR
jgi:hypothetical protein